MSETKRDDGGPASELPRSIRSETVEFLGYSITMHVLDDGSRIFEDTPGLRSMMEDLGASLDPESRRRSAQEGGE